MKSSKEKGPSSGSNAGRGFRYQDRVGALFVTRIFVGLADFSAVVPEGSDDFELRRPSGLVLVDTKSNRPDARRRTVADDKAAFAALWQRPATKGATIEEYLLVVERSQSVTDKAVSAATLFQTPTPPQADRSNIIASTDPMREAISLIVEKKALSPLAAELVVLEFAREAGRLADENGPRALVDRKAFTSTDAERIAARVLNAIDSDRLDRLVRQGFLAPVDFATPIDDEGFYLGVDVQPGHFAAGLALDRPDAAARVLDALRQIGTVAVTGPSGAGKSGLMWNAVISARDSRRWFKVNLASEPDPEAISAFFAANAETPIGFVIDDIGRAKSQAWNALRPICADHANAVLLGSIRSEDAALLTDRHTISEVNAAADDSLAEALWVALRERDQTVCPGWIEPWNMSNGLLLEYSHILTQGERLDSVILDQVRVRLAEQRDDELAILCTSAPIASHGGSAAIETLRAHLGLSRADMSRALERLIAEHLVRVDASGVEITGLHALRASSICTALETTGFASAAEQAVAAIACVASLSLTPVIRGIIAGGAIDAATASVHLADRFSQQPSLRDLARAIRGLRIGMNTLCARNWLDKLRKDGIPMKLATLSATFGVLQSGEMPDIGQLKALSDQGRLLFEDIEAQPIPPELVGALITALSTPNDASAEDYCDALSTLSRARLTVEERKSLAAARPPLDAFSISEIVAVLDAAESIDCDISASWTSPQPGQNGVDLLTRLSNETPFALSITSEQTQDGLVIHGDLFEAAVGEDDSPNDRLVRHCKAILRLAPKAQFAHVRLVDTNDVQSVHMDAYKRIPRVNAPPHAFAQTNRRVIDTVAREVCGESWSAYLARGEDLAERGLLAFRRLLNETMVGTFDQGSLDELNNVTSACDDLIAPTTSSPGPEIDAAKTDGRHLSPLQDLIFNLNASLVAEIGKLPENANRIAANVRKQIDAAEAAKNEPWHLIRSTQPNVLSKIAALLHDIEIVALEAAVVERPPRERWPKANRKPKGAFELAVRGSRQAFTRRIETRRHALEDLIARELTQTKVIAPTVEDGVIWRTRFLATFPIETINEFRRWTRDAHSIGDRIRAMIADEENICLIPLINGKAAIDYAYQLNRNDPASSFAKLAPTAGQASLLGSPDQALVDRLRAPIIAHPQEFVRFGRALRDVLGAWQFGFGTEERSAAEQLRVEQAIAELHSEGTAFLSAFNGIDHIAVDKIRTLVDLVSKEDQETAPDADDLSAEELHDALLELTWRSAMKKTD